MATGGGLVRPSAGIRQKSPVSQLRYLPALLCAFTVNRNVAPRLIFIVATVTDRPSLPTVYRKAYLVKTATRHYSYQ